ITSGTGVSKQVKANELVRIALSGESQVVESAEGSMSLSEAIVRMAITVAPGAWHGTDWQRSEEHTSELQSLMRISYAVFCLKTTKTHNQLTHNIRSDHQ